MQLLPIVEVWWRDAEAGTGWEDNEESFGKNCPLCRSVGMLIEKTDDVIIIANTSSVAQNNGRMRIPAYWVEKFYVLVAGSEDDTDPYGTPHFPVAYKGAT